jgi:3D (Asp-Asp-Asp) domain-containing protein
VGGLAAYYKVMISNNSNQKVLGATPINKKHGQVVNVDTSLCIREKPNLDSDASNYLYNGMVFDILEKDNGWYKIKYKDIIGYVKEDYIEEYDDSPPNPTDDGIQGKSLFKSLMKTPLPIKAELTAYCNCAICSEAWGSETAMQTHTRVGVVAAPKNIPLGSKIYIPELQNYKEDGIFNVEDRGGAVVVKSDGTYIIDVWLPNHEQVKEFGRKETTVYLME